MVKEDNPTLLVICRRI